MVENKPTCQISTKKRRWLDFLQSGKRPDAIVTTTELSIVLQLDPRTITSLSYALGGKRIGNRLRFRWGTVMEYFKNADIETLERKLLDGTGDPQWESDCLQDVPSWEEIWPRMAGSERMGGRTEETISSGNETAGSWSFHRGCNLPMEGESTYRKRSLITATNGQEGESDPFGLRAAFRLGRPVSYFCEANNE